MKIYIKHLLAFLLFLILGELKDIHTESFFNPQNSSPSISIHNRILAKVNEKIISVLDVIKKMDFLFYRQFPEYRWSVEARYQFYEMNWKQILQELIDKELIIADAEEHQIEISHGDVRQEMENLFGPNIIENLDQLGLSFEEAKQMIKEEILIRKMLFFRVHSKAISQLTPQSVKKEYEEYIKEHLEPAKWLYQILSIRGAKKEVVEKKAFEIYQLLKEEKITFSKLPEKLNEDEGAICKLSEEFHHMEKELSESYKKVLNELEPGNFSPPISQKSRSDDSTIFRIFYLKEITPEEVPSLAKLENALKEKLLGSFTEKEMRQYLTRIHTHFAVKENLLKEMMPEDFRPFTYSQ